MLDTCGARKGTRRERRKDTELLDARVSMAGQRAVSPKPHLSKRTLARAQRESTGERGNSRGVHPGDDVRDGDRVCGGRTAEPARGPRATRRPGLAGCESFFHAQVNLYTNEHTLKRLRRAHYYFIRYWRVLCEVWLCAMRIGAVRGRASL